MEKTLGWKEWDHESGIGKDLKFGAWNWACFFFPQIYGMYYGIWISILSFIPGIGLVLRVYLGFKGSGLAWSSNRWKSVHSFKEINRKWKRGSLLAVLILVGSVLVYFYVKRNEVNVVVYQNSKEIGEFYYNLNVDKQYVLETSNIKDMLPEKYSDCVIFNKYNWRCNAKVEEDLVNLGVKDGEFFTSIYLKDVTYKIIE